MYIEIIKNIKRDERDHSEVEPNIQIKHHLVTQNYYRYTMWVIITIVNNCLQPSPLNFYL